MAKAIEAYLDNRGNLYLTSSAAIVADLAAVLGRVGDEGGLTKGVAMLILKRRKEIEKAFADLDTLTSNQVSVIDRGNLINWHEQPKIAH